MIYNRNEITEIGVVESNLFLSLIHKHNELTTSLIKMAHDVTINREFIMLVNSADEKIFAKFQKVTEYVSIKGHRMANSCNHINTRPLFVYWFSVLQFFVFVIVLFYDCAFLPVSS